MQALEPQAIDMDLSTSTMNDNDETTPNWFEQALDDYDYERPTRGQFLEGVILRIDEDALLVDIGLKRDAIVPSWDLNMLPKGFLANLSPGSQVLVCIMRPPEGDQDLLVSLNKGLEFKSWQQAETYLENGLTFEVEIMGENRGGLLANFEGLRAFIPNSQVVELRRRDSQRVRQLKNEMIGQRIMVKVIEVDRDRQRLILSALAAEDEKRKKRLAELEERQIILGKVSSTVKFGVFVDLGGIDGLVHISELDWQRVDRPSDLFKIGDEIQVQVIGIDVERERVSLSRRALLPSPWQQLEQKFKPGDIVEGEVKNVLDFGAFIEVSEGIEGLVHVSEIGYSASGAPQDLVKPGERILVRILDINPERQRVSLSMRRVPIEDQIAWMAENEIRGQEPEAEKPGEEQPEAQVVEIEISPAEAAEAETPAREEAETETNTAATSETEPVIAEAAETETTVSEEAEAEAATAATSETEPVIAEAAETETTVSEEAEAEAVTAVTPETETVIAEAAETETTVSDEAEAETVGTETSEASAAGTKTIAGSTASEEAAALGSIPVEATSESEAVSEVSNSDMKNSDVQEDPAANEK